MTGDVLGSNVTGLPFSDIWTTAESHWISIENCQQVLVNEFGGECCQVFNLRGVT